MTSRISPAEYLLRAKRADYQLAERRLLAFLRKHLDHTCYVSFSAGKDSSVIAHACHSILPGIPILMSDSGVPYRWTAEERDQWLDYASRQGWNLRLFAWDKYAKDRPANDIRAYRRSVHSDQFTALTQWAHERGYTRRVMGLRRAESAARRHVRAITPHTLCPIADWPTTHVWSYIIRHGLPWLTIYDHLGPNARNGLIGRNGEERGRLVWLRRYYPESYRIAREIFDPPPQNSAISALQAI